ncbi:MAG: discoidin domain-containing protein, partial [Verrucomicrobiae bacterium]|nr:discoidin domain-containing protein [Verrucomicrobiae bacterium]
EAWKGHVRFRLLHANKTLAEQTQSCEVAPLGDARLTFPLTVPAEPGRYTLEAALVKRGAPDVSSLRDFVVLTPHEREARRNLAGGRPVKASSVLTLGGQTYRAEFAVDGKDDTRWSSECRDPQWLAVDLGSTQTISRVELHWEGAFAKAYTIQVSLDSENWRTVHATVQGAGKTETIRFTPTPARWVRLHGTERGTRYGYSLWEMGVYH